MIQIDKLNSYLGIDKSTRNKKHILLLVSTVFVFVSLLGNTFDIEVHAQQQNNTNASGNGTGGSTKTFKVTFDSLIINDDHDPMFSGEWVMDAYVNNELVNLFPGSISVDNGDTINFTGEKTATITIPNNENGIIRIATVGWENDIGFEPIPIFLPLMDTDIPFYLYTALVQQATVPHTVPGANDPNGFIAIQYNKQANFGVGPHSICSERNVAATDPSGPFESDCDYRINFTIEEIRG